MDGTNIFTSLDSFSTGVDMNEEREINMDPSILDELVELAGSEECVEECAKEAFEELKLSAEDEDFEIDEDGVPETLAMTALVVKLVEKGKIGPQEADKFIEDNL